MSRNVKIPAILVAVFAVVIAVIAISGSGGDDDNEAAAKTMPAATSTAQAPAARAVRADAHTLGRPGKSGVVFTEFLDFECEACAAAYPAIEQLRRQYAGRVTFAIRYMPAPSHFNAQNSALAVEAAARQGKLEAMYSRMYETQREWGEKQSSEAARFRRFAKELGLDMRRYDSAVTSDDALARVNRDRDEGVELGVSGTPTFFVGEQMIQASSIEDLTNALDQALAKT